jgi:hypothetical protein
MSDKPTQEGDAEMEDEEENELEDRDGMSRTEDWTLEEEALNRRDM